MSHPPESERSEIKMSASNGCELPVEVLRSIWNVSPLGMMVFRPGTESMPIVIEDCNPAVCRLHGYEREELIGKSIDLLQTVPWTQTIGKGWFESLKSKPLTGNTLHRRKDGFSFLIGYSVCYFEIDGQPRALGIDREMQSENDAETKARETAERWVNATEASDEGVWDWNLSDDTIWVSPRWNGLLGYKPIAQEISPDTLMRDVHPKFLKRINDGLDEALAGRSSRFYEEFLYRNKEGKWIWLLARGKPIFDSKGGALRMLGTISEITSRKRIEEELENARIEAEAANIAKSRFLATMSHEIRTPLNGVLGIATLLEDTKLDDEQRKFLKTIRSSGESLLSVINDVLDYSKVEAGALELESQEYDILECVEGAIDILTPLAANKSLDVFLHVDPEAPKRVVGDFARMRQMLLNIIGNAIKFTESGHVSIFLSRRDVSGTQGRAEHTNPELVISVEDSGIGIDAEAQKKLFKPFSQIDASMNRKYGGTGLGLVICKRIVQLMGGAIDLESELGKGSVFKISVPVEMSSERCLDEFTRLRGKRFLIVGGRKRVVAELRETFSKLGIELVIAEDSDTCKNILDTGVAPDLAILFDDLGGSDFTRTMHLLEQRGNEVNLPLALIVSSFYSDTHRSSPFVYKVRKPLKVRELLDRSARFFYLQEGEERVARSVQKLVEDQVEKKSECVLIVEDNEVNSLVATSFLSRFGYESDLATTGHEALEKAREVDYDIIFLDLHMPGISGKDTFLKLRDHYAKKGFSPWVVALTADALEGDREACLEAGMSDYLSKPLRPKELKQALDRALSHAAGLIS